MRAEARADARAPRLLAAVAVLALGAGGCTDVEDGFARVPFLNFMRESPALGPHQAPRPAPPLSVPVESPTGVWEPPVERTEAALQAFALTLVNPLPMDAEVLARGEHVYAAYCSVCHGPEGAGDGPLVGPGRFPFATDLTLPATTVRADGYLYAVVRVGRGLMPGYGRIAREDRWAVVNYLRQLQGQE